MLTTVWFTVGLMISWFMNKSLCASWYNSRSLSVPGGWDLCIRHVQGGHSMQTPCVYTLSHNNSQCNSLILCKYFCSCAWGRGRFWQKRGHFDLTWCSQRARTRQHKGKICNCFQVEMWLFLPYLSLLPRLHVKNQLINPPWEAVLLISHEIH